MIGLSVTVRTHSITLFAKRGVIVSRETVRLWVNRFGSHFAHCIKRDRPKPKDKWHLDEVVISIRGKKHWLWRAIDADGDVLDMLVQTRRNKKAARRFFKKLTEKKEKKNVKKQ